jgi:hypothetical protein
VSLFIAYDIVGGVADVDKSADSTPELTADALLGVRKPDSKELSRKLAEHLGGTVKGWAVFAFKR